MQLVTASVSPSKTARKQDDVCLFGEDRICHELRGRQMTLAVRRVLMIDNASNSELRDRRRWEGWDQVFRPSCVARRPQARYILCNSGLTSSPSVEAGLLG